MSQETAPASPPPQASSVPQATQSKKKILRTTVLLLILLGISLVAADRAVEGKLFTNLKNIVATTIGGGIKDEQKQIVDRFRNRLTDLRAKRDAITKNETIQSPDAASPKSDENAANPSALDSESN